MLVGKGALTTRCFRVSGKNPTPKPEKIAERLEQLAFAGMGEAEEGAVAGWIGPEHLFDGDFEPTRLVRGRYFTFALRVDTRKVPGGLLAAHLAVEVAATKEAEGLEHLSASRRRQLKADLKRRLLTELPPVQRAYGVFWNVHSRRLFLQSTSKAVVEQFTALFERTFDLEVAPHAPGVTAAEWAREHGALDALKDARPLLLGTAARNGDLAAVG